MADEKRWATYLANTIHKSKPQSRDIRVTCIVAQNVYPVCATCGAVLVAADPDEARYLAQTPIMAIMSVVITTANDMTTLATGEAKRHFGRLIDTSQREPVTIEKHGRPVAVVVSKHEYDKIQEQLAEARAWKETGYLLSTEANREALMEAIAQLNDS